MTDLHLPIEKGGGGRTILFVLLMVVAVLGFTGVIGFALYSNRDQADEASVKAAEAKKIAVTACKTAFGEMSSILRDSRAAAIRQGRLTEEGAAFYSRRLRRLRAENCEKAVERELLRRPRGGDAPSRPSAGAPP